MNKMQNMSVQVERIAQQNRFTPKNAPRGPMPNQRPPSSLEAINVAQHPYYCRACHALHDENTCVAYLEKIVVASQTEETPQDTCNNLFSGRQIFRLSQGNMEQVKERFIEAEKEGQLFGEMPSPEEIYQNKFKGLHYQRRKEGLSPARPPEARQRSYQPIQPTIDPPTVSGNSSTSPFLTLTLM